MADRKQDLFFLDTNIFVYSFDRNAPEKSLRATQLIRKALATRKGVVSYQVVQEFLNVATRKFVKPLFAAEAHLYLNRVLMPLCEIYPSASLYSQAVRTMRPTRL